MSYDIFEQGPEVYIPIILISLLITIVAYGAFPFVFARARKKSITRKKYRVFCYSFNALVMVLFWIINGGETFAIAPYMLWTSICSGLGIETLEERGVLLGKGPRARFCRKCGSELIDGGVFCSKCGTAVVNNYEEAAKATEEEEKEYAWAKKVVYEFGASHPAVKEIAEIKGISKQEVINQYETIIRDYNNK